MNHNVFLKYDGSDLLWSPDRGGSYEKLGRTTLTFTANGSDTVTFEAVDRISSIDSIDDGLDGTKKMMLSLSGLGSKKAIAIIIPKTKKGEIDKYSITFTPEGGSKPITIDPQGSGGGNP